jgi:hypothetical protein
MTYLLKKDGITTEVVHVADARRLKQAGYKEVKEQSIDDLTVAELKDLAKEQGLEGYSTLNKADLIKLLKGGN